ncbi:hypothetical protein COU80_01920 [Candidatus Peregrinibacteria bacterium CG10_big_fil_rev_8_21_14_0_10_55_24]|nr:MAG: hypothetical protein COU80_01920 [Candidatus Peregrinibacteria bacterium CG10_big_fil_rev_8_21_14_0_10_55_24]
MFDPVDPKQALPSVEEGILQYWREEDIFRRSVKERPTEGSFSFYDGPPFATGLPHYGHLLAGTIKDVIPRYQTMRGKRVERRFGWDCHGLPVENLIEKEEGIESHQQIRTMGIAAFNELCCGSVQRFTKEWRQVVERMGRWVDMDWDYRTMDPTYMESIWWVFGELWKKGLIEEGHKPMHVCPRCVTPLSNFEVTQGYKEVTDQSVTAKFALKGEASPTYLLAWTTTPWTLPGNLFLAVDPKMDYVKFQFQPHNESEASLYITSLAHYQHLLHENVSFGHTIPPGGEYREGDQSKYWIQSLDEARQYKGKDLIGKRYTPLFPYFAEKYPTAFRIVGADFVTSDEGTGVVHIAPGFGEDDYNLGKREGVEVLQHVTMEGRFVDEVSDFAGEEVKPIDDPSKMDRRVVEWLEKRGLVFAKETYRHSYPHCWRCDSPLLNYATSSWFVKVEKIKEDLLKANAETEWVPAHVRDGRFGKWLEGARDWAVSRNRFWGTPLPIWRCQETGDIEVIASRDDLMRHQPIRFTKVTTIRHGESEGNLIPIYQGETPGTDLTPKGKKQAKEAGKKLSSQNVDVIYCSPLARTQQTAAVIAKQTGAQVIVDDRLREVSFGEFEGKTVDFSDLSLVKARRAHKLQTGQPESIYHFPGMERWSDVQERIGSFLMEILPRHRSEHVLIVTHADPIQNIHHFFTGEDPLKISHQPYPHLAQSRTYFWDHRTRTQLDLHKHIVDEITWPASHSKESVDVLVVRHGQTDWNAQLKIQGKKDMGLNATGKEQALELAKKLKKERFDVVVSSTLKRSIETAQILSEQLHLPYEERWSEFCERDFGDWEGKTRQEVAPDSKGQIAIQDLSIPNGETLSAFLVRLEEGQRRLGQTFAGKRVLLVTHGGVLKALDALNGLATFREVRDTFVENTQTLALKLGPQMQRVSEVFDCWFESGSMPYAQPHFPFESQEKTPPGFPADFIAEGMDQTRGWFYTLMVLSTALYGEPAFKHCVVNGIVLAEDGKKMSKRLKNYPEPMELTKQYGADAVRFTLMSSPAVRGEDLRFSARMVEETMRSVMLPLWNAYSFFVTYANAAKFEPVETRRHSSHPLDQWIRTEVQDLANRMTEELDRYELSFACAELHDTIDALTNWYIRLSRRRFAGRTPVEDVDASAASPFEGIEEEDQLDALHTLYDVLLTMSQLLAPFCPFVTDAIYLNLVSENHGSVHLTDWPLPRALSKDEQSLLQKTRLMRQIVTLGHRVRGEQKVKVRQPLAKAMIAVPPVLRNIELSAQDRELLTQELNVKELIFTQDPGKLADVIARVDARAVGPRLGGRVQEVIAAGKRGDFSVEEDGTVLILDERLSPEEVQIAYQGKEGTNVAADHGVVVSLDTEISPELKIEGNARDLIRGIQRLRKEAGLAFTDRIALSIAGADEVLAVHGDLIVQETRATLEKNDGAEQTIDLNGHKVTIRFEKR